MIKDDASEGWCPADKWSGIQAGSAAMPFLFGLLGNWLPACADEIVLSTNRCVQRISPLPPVRDQQLGEPHPRISWSSQCKYNFSNRGAGKLQGA
jgi:hypothetical protein